jgi:hypothetical protein
MSRRRLAMERHGGDVRADGCRASPAVGAFTRASKKRQGYRRSAKRHSAFGAGRADVLAGRGWSFADRYPSPPGLVGHSASDRPCHPNSSVSVLGCSPVWPTSTSAPLQHEIRRGHGEPRKGVAIQDGWACPGFGTGWPRFGRHDGKMWESWPQRRFAVCRANSSDILILSEQNCSGAAIYIVQSLVYDVFIADSNES